MNLPRFTSKSLVSTSHNSHSLSRLNFVNSILITHSLSLSLSRVLRQFHFDSHSLSCSTCSVEFTLGNVEDEKSHAQFHKGFTQGIQFRVTNQLPCNLYYLIPMSISSLFMFLIWLCFLGINSSHKSGRVILVLDTDQSSHRNKVIYFSYLSWFEALNKFLWNCCYDRFKKLRRWWKLSWEVDG
jgi:hypothetical protein